MKYNFKPKGYNALSPYLMVNNASKFIEMLIQIFDAEKKRIFSREDGSIMHAELQIDDTVIMFADGSDKYPSIPVWLHVYLPDVDTVFDKAIEYGCEIVEKPIVKEGDSDKRGTFKDFAGNFWAIATQVIE